MTHLRPERHGLYDPANEHDACGVGFVAHVKGVASHQTVLDAASMLECMDHRGAYGCEMNTGDGAGMLTGMPDRFMRRIAKELFATELPASGSYSVGNVFLPTDEALATTCRDAFAEHLAAADLGLIGWREVPHDANRANLGPTALRSMPRIEQIFVSAAQGQDELTFERTLYMVRNAYQKNSVLNIIFRAQSFMFVHWLRVSLSTKECWLLSRLLLSIRTYATMITNLILPWFTPVFRPIRFHLGNVLNQIE